MKKGSPLGNNEKRNDEKSGLDSADAGRLSVHHQAVLERALKYIEEDGLSDTNAALLAGGTGAMLRLWRREFPEAMREMGQARAEFVRARMQAIREGGMKENKIDWRAQAWLIEQALTPEVEVAEGEEKPEVNGLPAQLVLTPKHLRELQRRREAALLAMRKN